MAKKPAKKQTSKTSSSKKAPASTADAQTPEAGEAAENIPSVRVLAQYIKDSSFENPDAPESLRGGQAAPAINLNVEVKAQRIQDPEFEVALVVRASAEREEKTVFLCELEYSGLFHLDNIPDEHKEGILLVECPRLLFPYARQIISDMTQRGGFPPLNMDPIDFTNLYHSQLAQRAQEAGETVN